MNDSGVGDIQYRKMGEISQMMQTTFTFLLLFLLNLAFGVLSADKYSRNEFPPDFVFGSGTTAYQVEGAANEDGRTPSIWDTYAYNGHSHGETGDVACDGYHKYKEDVQLMVETGLDAYRFSISWSRLIPKGRGPVNPKGLEYYNNLINELVKNGIQPHVTLYNFDLPQVLDDEYNGWVSRRIIKDFTYYADVCFREFGDRVLYWSTVNEPNIFSLGGYDEGTCPPLRCSAPFGFVNCTTGNSTVEPYLAAHHILLAHSSVVQLYRTKYKDKQRGFIGMSMYTFGLFPQTNTEKDIAAVQRVIDYYIGWFLEPLFYGDYPNIMKTNAGSRIPVFTSAESRQVKGSVDFIGVINYNSFNVTDNSDALKMKIRDMAADMGASVLLKQSLFTADEFPVEPWGLLQVLQTIKLQYGNPPIYIYENGQRTASNSSLHDVSRIKYLHGYIGSVLDALRNGSDVRGYFAWSFIDLFELLDGYESSFGLYYVDRNDPDLKRYPKLSAKWYSRFLKGTTTSEVETIQLDQDSSLFSVNHLVQ